MEKDTIVERIHDFLVNGNISKLNEELENSEIDIKSFNFQDGRTPLEVAILCYKIESVEYLLLNGVDYNQLSSINLTPLILAAKENNFDALELLILFGVDINVTDDLGKNALFYSLENYNFDQVELLLDNGIDLFHLDNKGRNALVYAADLVFDPILVSKTFGKSNRYYSEKEIFKTCYLYYANIVGILVSRGIEIDQVDRDEYTALYFAVKNDNWELVRNLLRYEASTEISDKQNNNVLNNVSKGKNEDIFKLLSILKEGLDRGGESEDEKSAHQVLSEKKLHKLNKVILDNNKSKKSKSDIHKNLKYKSMEEVLKNEDVTKSLENFKSIDDLKEHGVSDEVVSSLKKYNIGLLELKEYKSQKENKVKTKTMYQFLDSNDELKDLKNLFDLEHKFEDVEELKDEWTSFKHISRLLDEGIDLIKVDDFSEFYDDTPYEVKSVINELTKDSVDRKVIDNLLERGFEAFELNELHKKKINLEILNSMIEVGIDVNEVKALKNEGFNFDRVIKGCEDNEMNCITVIEKLNSSGLDITSVKNSTLHINNNEVVRLREQIENDIKIDNLKVKSLKKNNQDNQENDLKRFEKTRGKGYTEKINTIFKSKKSDLVEDLDGNKEKLEIVDVNKRFKKGLTVAMYYAQKGLAQELEEILKKGADVNARDYSGRTALIYACFNQNIECIETILKFSVEINHKDNNHQNALFYAVKKNYLDVLQVLLDHGAKLDGKFKGKTTLMVASECGHLPIVEYLVNLGLSPSEKDFKNKNSLDYAIKNKHDHVVSFLKNHINN